MNPDLLMAGVILAIHLAFILWVIFGWFFTRRRPLARSVHIACLIYSIFIEASNVSCPLTLLEEWFEARGGRAPYRAPFILHYLERVVYPDVSLLVLVTVSIAVCAGILGVYAWRFRHRDERGW